MSFTPLFPLDTLEARRSFSSTKLKMARNTDSKASFLVPLGWKAVFRATFVIILLIQVQAVCSLSSSEIAALTEILSGHPDLTSVPSWLQLTDDGQYYGRSWTNDMSQVCSSDGYDIYGVFCQGGSIVGLRMYEKL